MNINKFLVSMAFILVIFVLPHGVFAKTTSFSDIGSSYAVSEIQSLSDKGIISGYDNGTFQPNHNMTREEFATILAKTLKLPLDRSASLKFTDVDEWARPYVGAIVKANLASGISEMRFGARDAISREDLTVFMIRALGSESFSKNINFQASFSDEKQILNYAKPDVAFSQQIHFINGMDNGNGTFRFNPLGYADRQAVAVLAYKLYKNLDAYKLKISAMETVVNILDQATRTQQATNSYEIVWDHHFGLDLNQVLPPDIFVSPNHTNLTFDYIKSPFAMHEKGLYTELDEQNVVDSHQIESYVQDGAEYDWDWAENEWTKTTFNSSDNKTLDKFINITLGTFTTLDTPKDSWLAPYLTVAFDGNCYTLTGKITGQEYGNLIGDKEVGDSLKEIDYSITIDKKTNLKTVQTFTSHDTRGTFDSVSVTFRNYNQVLPIQTPQYVLNSKQNR